MASIFKRKNKDGSITWRLMIRRKGIKPFITGFSTERDARLFAYRFEKEYCLNNENFTYDHLRSRREREFRKKEM
jgi:hypothetical protein